MNAVDQLCPQCGLCCNGVLFGDVELQRGDDATQLAASGLGLFPKGRKRAFSQPCSCFDGHLCAIYAQRPGVAAPLSAASSGSSRVPNCQQVRRGGISALPDGVRRKF